MQLPELQKLEHLLAKEDPKRRMQGLRDALDSGPALPVAATQGCFHVRHNLQALVFAVPDIKLPIWALPLQYMSTL